jgi:hypothetical protein
VPVLYAEDIRNARLQVVADAIDAGPANGRLVIGSAGLAVVHVDIELAKPCASIAGGVLTLLGIPLEAQAAQAGTPAEAALTDSTGLVVADGLTVGISGANVILDSASVGAGQTVRINAGSITHG